MIPTLSNAKIKNKTIVIRVDFNVPIKEGRITEKTRITETIPTLKYLLEKGAKTVHILSHLGRPKGTPEAKFSLQQVRKELEEQLKMNIEFRENFKPGKGQIQLHENVRFYPGEKTNSPEFIELLLGLKGEIFINEAFAVSHRAHASVVGLPTYLPSYPGFLLQKEIDNLSPFLSEDKTEGLTVLVGGAKMETKINIIKHFAKTAQNVIIGGALANTFLAAQGKEIGQSLYEKNEIPTALEVFKIAKANNTNILLPSDVCGATNINATKGVVCSAEEVTGDFLILDVGPESISEYQEVLKNSQIIVWNGPLGLFEKTPFQKGTQSALKTIASMKSAKTILGGGDTLEAIKKFGVEKDAFTHVSTGGGAMLKFLEGETLPGIEALEVFEEG